MPPMDAETEITNSSDVIEQDVAQKPEAQAEGSPAAEAAPSPATDEPEKTALSVVRDVVDKTRPKPEAASSAEGVEAESEPAEKQPKEPDNENFSDVPFSKHPRFKQLLAERRELKVDADQFRTIRKFMDTNGLTPDETGELLIVGAMAKTDPRGTWERIKPWVQNLQSQPAKFSRKTFRAACRLARSVMQPHWN